jgi:hypothetical protein
MQFIGTFGRGLGINPDEVKLEDATKMVFINDLGVYGGSPMTLVANSGVSTLASWAKLAAAALPLNVPVYGVAKFQKNSYADETFDKTGLYGSGKGTVIQLGRVSLYNNVFRTADNGVVQVFAFDSSITGYVPMQKLYVNCDVTNPHFGQITNVLDGTTGAAANGNTEFGVVSAYYANATQPVLEILVK